MKIAIIGSRSFTDYTLLCTTVDAHLAKYKLRATQIVSGGAKGADKLAEKYALENQLEMIIYKPDWEAFGKRAGIIRNTYIVENSELIFAFWDGVSKGTKNTIDQSLALGTPIVTIVYENVKSVVE